MTRKLFVGATVTALLAVAPTARGGERSFNNKELTAIGHGRAVYITHCAGCHGPAARGGSTGKSVAPDLTQIALRDGRFDAQHVVLHVDGRFMDRQGEMPRWGKALATRPGAGGEAALKVFAVTRYLDFVQQPEGSPVGK